MDHLRTDGVTLDYLMSGSGEPAVFIHGAFVADAFRPLASEPSLADRYRLILYHRRGYGGSSRAPGPVNLSTQVRDCLALLEHLEVAQAHVVGHSFGGAVALQLALQAPRAAATLTLLEPALMVGDSAKSYRESLKKGVERYRAVGAEVVVDEMLEARWPGYRRPIERLVPGAFAQAIADAGTTFESELPGLLEWRFDEREARRIQQPVLAILGGESEPLSPRFGETQRTLLSWLPNVEGYVLPNATHFLQMENPHDLALRLRTFWERYPIRVRAK